MRLRLTWVAALGLVAAAASAARAVVPSEALLPATTKAYLSVPDMDDLRLNWAKTSLGRLTADPAMKPFVEDLKRQLRERLSETGVRLGVTLEDLEGVYGGEIAIASVQPAEGPQGDAVVLLVDITGREAQAGALLDTIAANMAERKAERSTREVAGVTIVQYVLPRRPGETMPRQAYYFVKNGQLAASDHQAVIEGVLARFDGDRSGSLAELPAYRAVLDRAAAYREEAPHMKWFVEPFGYADVLRSATGRQRQRGTDLLKVLRSQGFDAVQGMGGKVWVHADEGAYQFLHATKIYAPPVADPQTPGEKYRLAARMLDLGTARPLAPQAWIPRDVATYVTWSWKMKDAFYYAKTLVNQIADDEVFEDVLDSIKFDPNGPQVDLRNDLVAHLGDRATLLADIVAPITPDSERLLLAAELADAAPALKERFAALDKNGDGLVSRTEWDRDRLRYFDRLVAEFDADGDKALNETEFLEALSPESTLFMAMVNDPEAQRVDYKGHIIWQIVRRPEMEIPELRIDGPDFPGDPLAPPVAEEQRLFSGGALVVAKGHLMVSNQVDLLKKVIDQQDPLHSLSNSIDYQLVAGALATLGANEVNLLHFERTEEAARATYELLRQGRMPESQTLLGKLLNRFLGPREGDELRPQQIDASRLPEYAVVRRFLGPAGNFLVTEEDGSGWFVVGCMLNK